VAVHVALALACNERTSCSDCAAAPDPGSRPCFWCFDGASLGNYGTCKELGSSATGGGGLLDGCQNLTFAQGDCACRPAQRKTCSECTPDWNCVWSNATLSIEYTTPADPTPTVLTVGTGAACRVGTGFGGPDTLYDAATFIGPVGGQYTIAWVLRPATWYWSQCSIAGEAPAFLYAASGFVAILCCCGCIYFMCFWRRRRRAVIGGTASAPYYVYREWQPVAAAQPGAVRVANVPVGQPVR